MKEVVFALVNNGSPNSLGGPSHVASVGRKEARAVPSSSLGNGCRVAAPIAMLQRLEKSSGRQCHGRAAFVLRETSAAEACASEIFFGKFFSGVIE